MAKKKYFKIHSELNAAKDHAKKIRNRGGKAIIKQVYSGKKKDIYRVDYTF